jgi:hypothetical protein
MKRTALILTLCALAFSCCAKELKIYDAVPYAEDFNNKITPKGLYNPGCNLSIFYDIKKTASSSLPDAGGTKYTPDMLWDFNVRTAWVEGINGPGIGEWVQYRFNLQNGVKTDPQVDSDAVSIFTGYCKNEKSWKENNRVKILRVEYNGRKLFKLRFSDTMSRQFVRYPVVDIKPGGTLRFVVEEVYKGEKYDDTAISDLELTGGGCLE